MTYDRTWAKQAMILQHYQYLYTYLNSVKSFWLPLDG